MTADAENLIVAAMLKAAADGNTVALAKLRAMAAQPEKLQQYLDTITAGDDA